MNRRSIFRPFSTPSGARASLGRRTEPKPTKGIGICIPSCRILFDNTERTSTTTRTCMSPKVTNRMKLHLQCPSHLTHHLPFPRVFFSTANSSFLYLVSSFFGFHFFLSVSLSLPNSTKKIPPVSLSLPCRRSTPVPLGLCYCNDEVMSEKSKSKEGEKTSMQGLSVVDTFCSRAAV